MLPDGAAVSQGVMSCRELPVRAVPADRALTSFPCPAGQHWDAGEDGGWCQWGWKSLWQCQDNPGTSHVPVSECGDTGDGLRGSALLLMPTQLENSLGCSQCQTPGSSTPAGRQADDLCHGLEVATHPLMQAKRAWGDSGVCAHFPKQR